MSAFVATDDRTGGDANHQVVTSIHDDRDKAANHTCVMMAFANWAPLSMSQRAMASPMRITRTG